MARRSIGLAVIAIAFAESVAQSTTTLEVETNGSYYCEDNNAGLVAQFGASMAASGFPINGCKDLESLCNNPNLDGQAFEAIGTFCPETCTLGDSCCDTDKGATDGAGDTCYVYDQFPFYCLSAYDDSDFTGSSMCCVCGGGNPYTEYVAPSPPDVSNVNNDKNVTVGRLVIAAEVAGDCEVVVGSTAGVKPTLGYNECVQTKNYPNKYSDDQKCTITFRESYWKSRNPKTISAVSFVTEMRYDVLAVTPRSGPKLYFSGKLGDGPQDVVPKLIEWTSDTGLNAKGWKLCLSDEVVEVRAQEPVPEAVTYEVLVYGFMTIVCVWICPLLLVVPIFVTCIFALGGYCLNTPELARRVAEFPLFAVDSIAKCFYKCFDTDIVIYEPKEPKDEPLRYALKSVALAALWWLLTSVAFMVLILFVMGVFLIGFMYVIAIFIMLCVLALLTFMERVATAGMQGDKLVPGSIVMATKDLCVKDNSLEQIAKSRKSRHTVNREFITLAEKGEQGLVQQVDPNGDAWIRFKSGTKEVDWKYHSNLREIGIPTQVAAFVVGHRVKLIGKGLKVGDNISIKEHYQGVVLEITESGTAIIDFNNGEGPVFVPQGQAKDFASLGPRLPKSAADSDSSEDSFAVGDSVIVQRNIKGAHLVHFKGDGSHKLGKEREVAKNARGTISSLRDINYPRDDIRTCLLVDFPKIGLVRIKREDLGNSLRRVPPDEGCASWLYRCIFGAGKKKVEPPGLLSRLRACLTFSAARSSSTGHTVIYQPPEGSKEVHPKGVPEFEDGKRGVVQKLESDGMAFIRLPSEDKTVKVKAADCMLTDLGNTADLSVPVKGRAVIALDDIKDGLAAPGQQGTVVDVREENGHNVVDIDFGKESKFNPSAEDLPKLWIQPAKGFMSKTIVKWTIRCFSVLVIDGVVSVAIYFKFLVDAMLIEGGLSMLPQSTSSSPKVPVYQVAFDMQSDFSIMAIIMPFIEVFKPVLKWFLSWLDWNVSCSPAHWFVHSVMCVGATFIGFLWCATDVAAVLFDRQKRLERSKEGFLKPKIYAQIVALILNVNFYLLQVFAQTILSGLIPMGTFEDRKCDPLVWGEEWGMWYGYSFTWALCRVVSFFGMFLLLSAFFLVVTGLHFDFGLYIKMSELVGAGSTVPPEWRDKRMGATRYSIRQMNSIVVSALPLYFLGMVVLLPCFGKNIRKRILLRSLSEHQQGKTSHDWETPVPSDSIQRTTSGRPKTSRKASDNDGVRMVAQALLKEEEDCVCFLSKLRLKKTLGFFLACVGMHPPRENAITETYALKFRCLVWHVESGESAQPENVQVGTGKVLAVAMSAFPFVGPAIGKLLQYNNESSALLNISQEVKGTIDGKEVEKGKFLLNSGLQDEFEAFEKEKEKEEEKEKEKEKDILPNMEWPVGKWVTFVKLREYFKWCTMFALSVCVILVAVEPSATIFVAIFFMVLVLQLLDGVVQLAVKKYEDEVKLKRDLDLERTRRGAWSRRGANCPREAWLEDL